MDDRARHLHETAEDNRAWETMRARLARIERERDHLVEKVAELAETVRRLRRWTYVVLPESSLSLNHEQENHAPDHLDH